MKAFGSFNQRLLIFKMILPSPQCPPLFQVFIFPAMFSSIALRVVRDIVAIALQKLIHFPSLALRSMLQIKNDLPLSVCLRLRMQIKASLRLAFEKPNAQMRNTVKAIELPLHRNVPG